MDRQEYGELRYPMPFAAVFSALKGISETQFVWLDLTQPASTTHLWRLLQNELNLRMANA